MLGIFIFGVILRSTTLKGDSLGFSKIFLTLPIESTGEKFFILLKSSKVLSILKIFSQSPLNSAFLIIKDVFKAYNDDIKVYLRTNL